MTASAEPPRTILLIEPDPAVAGPLCAVLRRRGHTVRLAVDADEARAAAAAAVIVCNVDVPGASGIDVVRERLSRERAHVLFLAAQPSLADCRAAMQIGAADLLPLPVPPDELVAAVERAPAADADEGGRRRLHQSFAATREGVDRAVREVAAFALRCGIGPVGRSRVASACAEVLDNARRHAYRDQVGDIELRAGFDGARVSVRIADRGAGFDAVRAQLDSARHDEPPPAMPGGARAFAAPRGGLARATSLSEELRVDSGPRGTSVRLVFELHPAVFEDEEGVDLADLDWLEPDLARRVLETAGTDRDDGFVGVSPALAVTIGRLMAGRSPEQTALTALWS